MKLTKDSIEDAATWAALNNLELIEIRVSPETLSGYNKCVFDTISISLSNKERLKFAQTIHISLHKKGDVAYGTDEVCLMLKGKHFPNV